jgi:hypothetical protein
MISIDVATQRALQIEAAPMKLPVHDVGFSITLRWWDSKVAT